jgi:putative transposase
VNKKIGGRRKVLEWQAGYGVVIFGTQNLPWVKRYIQRQKAHHAKGTIEDRLERITAIESAAKAEQREAP